eukprot:Nk52_evm31s2209 gene=Nk52_evmTU31s2209
MYEAFYTNVILEQLPLGIESISSYDDTLLVGTNKGYLLIYNVSQGESEGGEGDGSTYNVCLVDSKKGFARKAVTQLAAVPEAGIILSLSENIVHVHDLNSFAPLDELSGSSACTAFAVKVIIFDPKVHNTEDYWEGTEGGGRYRLSLCCVVRRKLLTYEWINNEFRESKDFIVPDVARAIMWCNESTVCCGFRKEYNLINVDTGEITELFPTGRSDPIIAKITEEEILLGKDDIGIFICTSDGSPSRKYGLTLSQPPIAVDMFFPYLAAILPTGLEIRTMESFLKVQTIPLPSVRMISRSKNSTGEDVIFIASNSNVWKVKLVPLVKQVDLLVGRREYEEALELAKKLPLDMEDRNNVLKGIHTKLAFSLFIEHRFDEAMEMFVELRIDPLTVIGLYPNLISQEKKQQLSFPISPPLLDGDELKNGLMSLIHFLTLYRRQYIYQRRKKVDEGTKFDCPEGMEELVDTTLLKCYLQTNFALINPLLRLENSCNLEESEKLLKEYERYPELILLYKSKGLHRKALELLYRYGNRSNNDALELLNKPELHLQGPTQTVSYLKTLDKEDAALLLEFSSWVLKRHPEEGLTIFTDDSKAAQSLNPLKVLDHIQRTDATLCMLYLETIVKKGYIKRMEDKIQGRLHDELILKYLQELREYFSIHKGQKDSELDEHESFVNMRLKLLRFLKFSDKYNPEKMLSRFPFDRLHEERATLLGRIGQHEQALLIYVYELDMIDKAEEYCALNFDRAGWRTLSFNQRKALVSLEETKVSALEHTKDPALSTLESEVLNREKSSESEKLHVGSVEDLSRSGVSGGSIHSGDMGSKSDLNASIASVYISSSSSEECLALPEPTKPCKHIYLTLLKMLLSPPLGKTALFSEALKLAEKYHSFVSPSKFLELLPPGSLLSNLKNYIECVFKEKEEDVHRTRVLKNLYRTENIRVRERLVHYRSKQVNITDTKMCPHCNKRIGNR